MASCGTCGKADIALGRPCPQCGTMPEPDLELNVRARPTAKSVKPRKVPEPEMAIELGIDPRQLVQQRPPEPPLPAPMQMQARAPSFAPRGPSSHATMVSAGAGDVESDARVLADYGDAPRTWLLAPVYAWRVLRKQRELKTALAGRKVEAEHASVEVEDALVGFAERVRPAAEKQSAYMVALEDLSRAEDLLRSRDNVLAAEQDAQKARLGQVDARLAKTEDELLQAQTEERLAAQDLVATQNALEREEAKLKRAEVELKGALQRTGAGGAS
jgi:hypothetical protein